jgi:hypothetical protein
MGRTDLAYTNVAGLPAYARVVAEPARWTTKGAPRSRSPACAKAT